MKVYNHYKMKSLPSSFMARCRVFIERAGQEYQIATALGLTFRNSKWTDYSLTNINRIYEAIEFNTILNWALIFILAYLTVVSITRYDINYFYIYYIFIRLLSQLQLTITTLLYSWAVSSAAIQVIIPLFTKTYLLTPQDFRLDSTSQKTNHYITSSLDPFKGGISATPTPALSKLSNTFISKQLFTTASSKPLTHPTVFRFIPTPPSLHPQALKLVGVQTSTKINKLLYRPTIFNFSLGRQLNQGWFYIDNLNYQNLNQFFTKIHLTNFQSVLGARSSLVNTLRWSYRYNLLHRRSMYNSHKLTEAKKLISFGFFDSTSTKSNLWFSDQFARALDFSKKSKNLTSLDLIKANWSLLYKPNFTNLATSSPFKLPSQTLSSERFLNLSFYESSFHFFLNRVKFYSSLQSNEVAASPIPLTDSQHLVNELTPSQLFFNYSLLELLKLSPSTLAENTYTGSWSAQSPSFSDNLIISSNNELLNRKNLDIAYSVTRSTNLSFHNLPFYFYLNDMQPHTVFKNDSSYWRAN